MTVTLKKSIRSMPTPPPYVRVEAGVAMDVGVDITAIFLGPVGAEYSKLNNYSTVLLFTFGNTRFLFMGDAEQLSEAQIMDARMSVHADVLKVGHHGSNTSSSDRFLNAVAPTYAVISVGKDNRYGLPADNALQRLDEHQITILRTDMHGTIVISSDGETIQVATTFEAVL